MLRSLQQLSVQTLQQQQPGQLTQNGISLALIVTTLAGPTVTQKLQFFHTILHTHFAGRSTKWLKKTTSSNKMLDIVYNTRIKFLKWQTHR